MYKWLTSRSQSERRCSSWFSLVRHSPVETRQDQTVAGSSYCSMGYLYAANWEKCTCNIDVHMHVCTMYQYACRCTGKSVVVNATYITCACIHMYVLHVLLYTHIYKSALQWVIHTCTCIHVYTHEHVHGLCTVQACTSTCTFTLPLSVHQVRVVCHNCYTSNK